MCHITEYYHACGHLQAQEVLGICDESRQGKRPCHTTYGRIEMTGICDACRARLRDAARRMSMRRAGLE